MQMNGKHVQSKHTLGRDQNPRPSSVRPSKVPTPPKLRSILLVALIIITQTILGIAIAVSV